MAVALKRMQGLEDETGIVNIILKPDVFARLRVTVVSHP
jgi:hypothetical protein